MDHFGLPVARIPWYSPNSLNHVNLNQKLAFNLLLTTKNYYSSNLIG